VSELRVLTVSDEVEYADGSIVSRVLHEQPAGSITLFAVDRDQSIEEHTSPFDAYVQVLEGRAFFRVRNRHYELRSGQALILPARIPHAMKAPERCKFILVMIRG